MKTKKTYDEEAANIAKAADIAIDAITNYPPETFTQNNISQFVHVYTQSKHDASNPKPEFRKLASLKYIEHDLFIYFQEGHGKAVQYFWQQIAEQQLPYKRIDRLPKILSKKKIGNMLEYDFVIDNMVVYKQEGRLTDEEWDDLNKWIGEFEARQKKKAAR